MRSVMPSFPASTVALALGLLVPLALACQSDEDKLSDFRQRGDAYVASEDWNEAIIEYRNVLKLAPNDGDAHYALAKAYMASRKMKEAYWELSETARIAPENTEARIRFAQFSLAARDFEEALSQTEGIIALEPENAAASTLRGQALEGLQRGDEAEAAYRAAMAADPDEPGHLLVLAAYHGRRRELEKAEPLLVEYAERDPGYISWTALARLLIQDPERRPEAFEAFQKALDSAEDERLVEAYRNLAGYHFAVEDFDMAATTLREGIERVDEKLDLIYLLARFYRSQGEVEKADALVEEATLSAPDDPRPHLVLSAYRGRKGDVAGALEAAEAALAADSENQKAKLRIAELLVDMGFREDDVAKISRGEGIVTAVLALEPTSPDGLFVRAKIEMAQKRPLDAVASLRASLDGRPDWAQAHFVLGSALALSGDPAQARASLARAVELDPALLEARRLLAKVHANLSEHEYAIEHGRVYLRERPLHVATSILVAQSLVRLGKHEEAWNMLKALPAEDLDSEAFYALARLQMARGELDDARENLLSANELKPNHPDILRSLLQAERALGKLPEARARIDAAAVEEPNDARIAQLVGLGALVSGDLKAAERGFVRATQLDPDDISGYEQLAYFYRITGRLDETIATYERALEKAPESAKMHHFLAVLYEFSGRTDDAIAQYELAIEHDPRLGEAKNNLAYLLAEGGTTLDRALDLAQEAKGLLPDSPNTADTLGWVLLKRGVPSAAVGYLREAVAGLDPGHENVGVIQHHLAQAYEANGEREKAIESLDAALDAQVGTSSDGTPQPEPEWAGEARAMRDRLRREVAG